MIAGIPSYSNPEGKVFGLLGELVLADDGQTYLKKLHDGKNIGWSRLFIPVPVSPTPTPTTTPAVTPSLTPNGTQPVTPTPTAPVTATPTPTVTSTPTMTPSVTPSLTPDGTQPVTPTPTLTPTETLTPTPTPTLTPTATEPLSAPVMLTSLQPFMKRTEKSVPTLNAPVVEANPPVLFDAYQWKKYGVDVLNATKSLYHTLMYTEADMAGGKYSVSATNTVGSATSNAVWVTAYRQPYSTADNGGIGKTDLWHNDPESGILHIFEDTNEQLNVDITGDQRTFQWYYKPTESLVYNLIPGATDSFLGTNRGAISTSGSYKVDMQNMSALADDGTVHSVTVSASVHVHPGVKITEFMATGHTRRGMGNNSFRAFGITEQGGEYTVTVKADPIGPEAMNFSIVETSGDYGSWSGYNSVPLTTLHSSTVAAGSSETVTVTVSPNVTASIVLGYDANVLNWKKVEATASFANPIIIPTGGNPHNFRAMMVNSLYSGSHEMPLSMSFRSDIDTYGSVWNMGHDADGSGTPPAFLELTQFYYGTWSHTNYIPRDQSTYPYDLPYPGTYPIEELIGGIAVSYGSEPENHLNIYGRLLPETSAPIPPGDTWNLYAKTSQLTGTNANLVVQFGDGADSYVTAGSVIVGYNWTLIGTKISTYTPTSAEQILPAGEGVILVKGIKNGGPIEAGPFIATAN